jgi:hypothetical protein
VTSPPTGTSSTTPPAATPPEAKPTFGGLSGGTGDGGAKPVSPTTTPGGSPPPPPAPEAPPGGLGAPTTPSTPGATPGGAGASAPAGTEEHSRFIPALGPPRTEDGTPLRPTPTGPPSGAPADGGASGGSTIPPPQALGVTPAPARLEPVGATPRAIAPAIQAGAPPIPRPETPPVAKSYSVTRYVCQAGDTFASVAKQYYGREDFAAALQAFNRVDSHRCGSPALSNDGKLAPGDAVYVPMLAALESEAAGYLPKPEATPASFPAPGKP